jgi:hypothetical protein
MFILTFIVLQFIIHIKIVILQSDKGSIIIRTPITVINRSKA